jgi:polyferredoxin
VVLGRLLGVGQGRCKGSLRRRKTSGVRAELREVDRPPIITRSEVSWVVFIVLGIAFLVGVAVLIGSALTALPFIWGTVVAFAVLVLVAALVGVELRRFWPRLPR